MTYLTTFWATQKGADLTKQKVKIWLIALNWVYIDCRYIQIKSKNLQKPWCSTNSILFMELRVQFNIFWEVKPSSSSKNGNQEEIWADGKSKIEACIGQPKLIQSSYWLNLQHHLCFQIGSSMSITVMDLEKETPHGQLLKVCFDIFAIVLLFRMYCFYKLIHIHYGLSRQKSQYCF